MVIAMFLGMAVLGLPAEAALGAVGSGMSELHDTAPAALLVGMATIMTVPMVAWMRVRGHRWRPCAEMGASMYVPTFAVVGLLAVNVIGDVGTLMAIQHVVMLPAMLVAMLLRRDEYSGHAHHHTGEPAAA